MTNIATKLKDLRIERGLSQEKLAEQLMVSRQAVSKWENGEALPDMENLIALAKLYDMSLDDLVGIKKEAREAPAPEAYESKDAEMQADTADSSAQDRENITENEDNDDDDDDDDDDDNKDDDDSDEAVKKSPSRTAKILHRLPYPIIITAAFILLGVLADAWYIAWILFVTIPVYDSIIHCIAAKRFKPFAYPVFITCLFLYLGMQFAIWHPAWVIFLTIPIYYAIAAEIDKAIAKKKNNK